MKKIVTSFLLIASLFFFGCNDSRKKIEREQARLKALEEAEIQAKIALEAQIKVKKAEAISAFINQFSLEELIPQLFIENINGNRDFRPVEKINEFAPTEHGLSKTDPQKNPNDLQNDEENMSFQGEKTSEKNDAEMEIRSIIPGGFLFFSYNLAETPEETMKFTDSIKSFCKEKKYIPPFLAIDQEGGFVNRLKSLCGPLPSEERVSTKLTLDQAYALYSLQAKQMKLLGLNMNLAPVVEICTDSNRDFLNQRSFGNKEKVMSYGKKCIQAYEQNGISTVLKHFPGNTNTDPHSGLPEINLSENDLHEMISPFEELIKENPAGILMSHAKTSGIDAETPSCLSSVWVTQILRNELKYDGIIFSDDIFMAALAKNGYPPEKAAELAIEAGIDCIMISEKRIKNPCKIIYEKCLENEMFRSKVESAIRHIIEYKIDLGLLQMTENDDSTFTVDIPTFENENDISARVKDFQAYRDENIELYKNNF